tara:strand:+ start:184 stop:903 length:720 start_codon:yes stop_codon:yes gene_type:complete
MGGIAENTLLLVIEGNITTGKTIFVNNLAKTLQKISNKIYIHNPNTKQKHIISDDINICDLFYLDPKRWTAEFLMNTLSSKLDFLNKHSQEPNSILIMERSIKTESEVFIKSLYDCNMITNVTYKICCELVDAINGMCELFLKSASISYIYLKTDPTDLFDALIIHNVYDSINFTLLNSIHKNYERYLNKDTDELKGDVIQLNIPFEQIFKPNAVTIKNAFKQLQHIYPIFQNIPPGSF